ncbi:MAG: hypothetical protein WDN25_18105 [Acetobacteraceae bacterium]
MTRLCSSGRSSQIAEACSRWPFSRRNTAWCCSPHGSNPHAALVTASTTEPTPRPNWMA